MKVERKRNSPLYLKKKSLRYFVNFCYYSCVLWKCFFFHYYFAYFFLHFLFKKQVYSFFVNNFISWSFLFNNTSWIFFPCYYIYITWNVLHRINLSFRVELAHKYLQCVILDAERPLTHRNWINYLSKLSVSTF